MLTEIDKDFYCSATCYDKNGIVAKCVTENGLKKCVGECENFRRKYPTPEQFKEEYGEEWTGAVYYIDGDDPNDTWELDCIENAIEDERCYIVCACTPFGIPPKEWRPK
ncbi:MAG: hypothetical protein FWB73_00235 [Treponema sp.]|nr:hypothetical protein [Treponema sp.]